MELSKIIIHAFVAGLDVDQVEDAAWTHIEQHLDISHIQHGVAMGVLSVDWKFYTTSNMALARMLWNEFADDITTTVREPWKHSIQSVPRATRPDMLQWHGTRLREANLPITVARVQLGELFGGVVEWGEILKDTELDWHDGLTTVQNDTYPEWDSDNSWYYDDTRFMRVAL